MKTKAEDATDFDGPLDLILSLLSKNKMEIKDIQIALILEQYMDWLKQRQELDLEVASEFVTMAAHLVYIKTRMLLSVGDEEVLSEMDLLIASLEEHQRHENFAKIKAIVPTLADRNAIGRDYITKVPEHRPVDKTYHYAHKPVDIQKAMLSVMERTDNKLPPPMAAFEGIVGREPYPVGEKATEIIQRLMHFGVTRFQALFRGNRSRSEVVATFIAVLELCKSKRLHLAGTERDCTVTYTGQEGEIDVTSATGEEGGV